MDISAKNGQDSKRIQFHIATATSLPTINRSGKAPTAYVTVKVPHLKVLRKTSTVKQQCDPEWHENLAPMMLMPTSTITLEVWHRSKWSKSNRILGRVEYSLDNLLDMQGQNDRQILILLPLHSDLVSSTKPTLSVNIRELASVETAAAATAAAQAAKDADDLKKMSLSENITYSTYTVQAGLEQLSAWLELLAGVPKVGTSIDQLSSSALGVVISVAEVVKDQLDRDLSVLQLVEIINHVYWLLETSGSLPKIELLQQALEELLLQTIQCLVFIQEYSGHGFAGGLKGPDSVDQIDNFKQTFERLEAVFNETMPLKSALATSEKGQAVTVTKFSENLIKLHSGHIDTSMWPRCAAGTGAEIIKLITQWVTSAPGNTTRIFWLHGLPGSGKTTISTTMSDCFGYLKRLGGYISFSQNIEEKNKPADAVRSLAYQLSMFNSQIAYGVSIAIEKDPDFKLLDVQSQFKKLVVEPLCAMDAQSFQGPFLIIIDAFDECGTSHEQEDILSLLLKGLQLFPPFVHILITSRPLYDIQWACRGSSDIFEYAINGSGDDGHTQIQTSDSGSGSSHGGGLDT